MISKYSPSWTMVRFEFDRTPEGQRASQRFRRAARRWIRGPIRQGAYHLVPASADRLEAALRPHLPSGAYSQLEMIPITDRQIEVSRTFHEAE